MGAESLKPASILTGAVFLSYASQDADAARQICDALRAAGIEVWFDQSELRGGDAWDQSIRRGVLPARMEARGRSLAPDHGQQGFPGARGDR